MLKNFSRESFIKYINYFFTKGSGSLESRNILDIIFNSFNLLKKDYFGPNTSKITKIPGKYYFFIFKYLTQNGLFIKK